jgi:hypothetical protein
MPQASAVTVNSWALDHTSNAIAASEVAGPFDTVDIYSLLPGYPGEIYEVAVQKLA